MPLYDGKKLAHEGLLDVIKHCTQAALSAPQITGKLDLKVEIVTEEELQDYFDIENEMHKLMAASTGEAYKRAYDMGEPPVVLLIGADCSMIQRAPCKEACPAGLDVPRHIRLIGDGKYAEALAVIRESFPFPSSIGYICRAPCEVGCKRGERGDEEPITIRALHRFAYEKAGGAGAGETKVAEPTGKRVAVVGSGPAGLTAAYYLAKVGGHAVTVFEALPKAGGMMRVGIPDYRLPKNALDADIDAIKAVGVDIKTNTKIGSLDTLLKEGYDATLLAIGAHKGAEMGIEGEESARVIDGVTFLKDVNLGKKIRLGARVAVIGGGNVAVDAARTALRLGAKEVTIIYRRSQAEVPADKSEIQEALNEGVKAEFLATPTKAMTEKGVVKLECIRMQLGAVDETGRPRPEPVAGSEFTVEVESVIVAIGEAPEIPRRFRLAATAQGTLAVDSETLATDRDGVFACGDGVRGPTSIIEAIAAGRKAAMSIDEYLGGSGVIDEVIAPSEEVPEIAPSGEAGNARPQIALLPVEQRLDGFAGVELTMDEGTALAEARRCLSCDQLGWNCGACGHKTCREAVIYNREQVLKPNQAGVTGGWGWIWRGPSCIWKILELGIACDWACAVAHDHNVPNRIQMIPGGLFMRMGYMEGCTAVMALPVGPCRESWYSFEPGSGASGRGYRYQGAMARQTLTSPNLFIRFLGPGRDMGRTGMKTKDDWWEPPYSALEVVPHPEWDQFIWDRDKKLHEAGKEIKKKRKAKKAEERRRAKSEQ